MTVTARRPTKQQQHQTPRYRPGRDTSEQLIKVLEHACTISGYQPYQIFEDWIAVVDQTMEAMPRHVSLAVRERRLGRPDEDTPECQEVWSRCSRRDGAR